MPEPFSIQTSNSIPIHGGGSSCGGGWFSISSTTPGISPGGSFWTGFAGRFRLFLVSYWWDGSKLEVERKLLAEVVDDGGSL